VLKTAAAVTTVSEGIAEMFAAKAENRYAVIQNGFEPLPPQRVKTEKFVLLFIGHLSKHQDPETIFQAVTTLPEQIRKTIQLQFIGRIFEGFREIFEKYQEQIDIITKGYMPHRELLEFAQRNASLLLRPIARTSYSQSNVGAKTSDYLALRKPMLTLGEKGGFSEQMLTETDSGQMFEYEDIEGIAKYIQEIYREWEAERYVILDNEKKLEKYTTRYNVGKLVELFESIEG
jgi:glycosyltransferase involved in cell wall biosynthesis